MCSIRKGGATGEDIKPGDRARFQIRIVRCRLIQQGDRSANVPLAQAFFGPDHQGKVWWTVELKREAILGIGNVLGPDESVARCLGEPKETGAKSVLEPGVVSSGRILEHPELVQPYSRELH